MKTKQLILLSLVTSLLMISCGGGDNSNNLAALKQKQADLKTELANVSTQISKLEGDSANKFVLVDAAPVPMRIFKTYINVQGRIDADENVALSAEMPGTISKINVKTGDQVSKGQVLAETDARAIQQSLSDMQTNLDLVNQMYEKQKNLWDQKIGTEVQFLQAKAQKESMEKKMITLQEQLRMSKIISPIDGTVDAVDIKLGQLTAPGMPAIRVINFNNLKVKADLAESYASKVHKGDEVIIKFPDSNDSAVAPVSYAARAISALNRTFNVEVLLDNKKEYHPNQIAILNINDYRSEKPTMAIALNYIQKDLKGQHFVLVAEGNKAAKRNVTLGKEYNGTVEITSGLNENDLLITSGYDGLNEGDAIKIKK
ncbi:MAG TPA: efflux RND transporter periplasmic adaptor subunit [Bacteroidia bacterium]|jgi:membrane fusion protein (multidrug efflux system)|nr:efflux RND transporter periplasmic adaptor subunit [Bacteroidia bacterium]